MTKKDYKIIAKVIAKVPLEKVGRSLLLGELYDALLEDNPKFSIDKFMEEVRKWEMKENMIAQC